MSEEIERPFIAKVSYIIDDKKIVINKGSINGIKKNQTFLIYRLGDEIKDPDTNENLGNLELIVGRGIVTHVQEKNATLTSNIIKAGTKRIIRSPIANITWSRLIGLPGDEEITEPGDICPYEDPQIGDLVKPV